MRHVEQVRGGQVIERFEQICRAVGGTAESQIDIRASLMGALGARAVDFSPDNLGVLLQAGVDGCQGLRAQTKHQASLASRY